MDASALAIEFATGKLTELAESLVRKRVIERWSRYRAEQFFEAFCQTLLDLGVSDAQLAGKLDELLEDDQCSQVVFDAYRAVCLTRSRNVGPRVIALLTAELVIARAKATADDDAIFSVAEELSDDELHETGEFVLKAHELAQRQNDGDYSLDGLGTIKCRVAHQVIDAVPHSRGELSLGPLDLAASVGVWAAKLQRYGLL